jgi:hypothetical protein
MRALVAALLAASAFTLTTPVASAQDRQLAPYIPLLRTDLKTQRAALSINNMELTEAESGRAILVMLHAW